jgi:hypothetical protein
MFIVYWVILAALAWAFIELFAWKSLKPSSWVAGVELKISVKALLGLDAGAESKFRRSILPLGSGFLGGAATLPAPLLDGGGARPPIAGAGAILEAGAAFLTGISSSLESSFLFL